VGAIHHRCVLAKNSIRLVASNTRGDVHVCQDDPEAKFAIALTGGFRVRSAPARRGLLRFKTALVTPGFGSGRPAPWRRRCARFQR
jgi:hypothetical protein